MSYPVLISPSALAPTLSVGDVLCLPLPVGAANADGIHPLRLAAVAAVDRTFGAPVYELVPAALEDDLPAHQSDIATGLSLDDGSEMSVRLSPKRSVRLLPDAQVLAGNDRPVGRLPQMARASLVGAQAQRETSRRRHEEARRLKARQSARGKR